jgi:hypothetical protein
MWLIKVRAGMEKVWHGPRRVAAASSAARQCVTGQIDTVAGDECRQVRAATVGGPGQPASRNFRRPPRR